MTETTETQKYVAKAIMRLPAVPKNNFIFKPHQVRSPVKELHAVAQEFQQQEAEDMKDMQKSFVAHVQAQRRQREEDVEEILDMVRQRDGDSYPYGAFWFLDPRLNARTLALRPKEVTIADLRHYASQ
jgi:hypothetical protein